MAVSLSFYGTCLWLKNKTCRFKIRQPIAKKFWTYAQNGYRCGHSSSNIKVSTMMCTPLFQLYEIHI